MVSSCSQMLLTWMVEVCGLVVSVGVALCVSVISN